MKENNLDKAIREKLEGFSVPPPPSVWAGVQGQLVAQRRKKRLALFSWISAAAVVVLALLAGWYLNNNTPDNRLTNAQQAIEQQIAQQKNSNNIFDNKNIKTQEQILPQTTQKNNNKIVTEYNKKEIKDSNKTTTTNSKELLVNKQNSRENINKEKLITQKNEKLQTAKAEKRLQMKKMKRLGFQFKNIVLEIALAKHSTQNNEITLTDADKLLMASNITSAKSSKSEKSVWKMGLNITPGYSSQVANHSNNYARNMSYVSETGNTNIGGGFSVQYKTSKRVSIESGVYYAQNGQKSRSKNNLFARSNDAAFMSYENAEDGAYLPAISNSLSLNNGVLTMNGNAGVIAFNGTPKDAEIATTAEAKDLDAQNTIITNGEFLQVFNFVEIPLLIRYCVLDKKMGVELVGGLNTGVVVGNNAYIDNSYGIQNIGSTQDVSSINLSGAVGVGMNYTLGKHISVAVEPRLNYYFSSINSNPEVDYHPYRVSIFTGVYYAF